MPEPEQDVAAPAEPADNQKPDRFELARQIVDADMKREQLEEKVEKLKEAIKDEINSTDLGKAVHDMQIELNEKRKALQEQILGDSNLQKMKDNLTEYQTQLSVQTQIVSSLLVHWTAETRTRSIEVNDEMHIIHISARIGRKQREQMELPL